MPATPRRPQQHTLQNYAYFSNLAIEMGVIIALGVFGGIKLDKWLNLSPLFTLVCSLSAVGISLYIVIKGISQLDKNKKNESKNTY